VDVRFGDLRSEQYVVILAGGTMPLDRIAELLELSEAEAVWGYEQVAPPEVQESLGMASQRIGGGVVLSVRNDVTNYWSKALGFGFAEPVTAELVAEITAFYRDQGTKLATLQLAPAVLPVDWDAICKAEGLTPGGTWVKLARLAGLVESPRTDMRVGIAGSADAEEWWSVLLQGFGMAELGLDRMAEGLLERPGWTAYGAWDGDQMVAAAALLITGQVAEFAGAATLPSHRGKGAQPALLAARARQAAAEGVKWLSAETGKPAKGKQNPSLNNLLRTGFEIRYERQSWIWRP
jgi:GNAT superfamily N-acetyltransferase